jgi:hypothetical protein
MYRKIFDFERRNLMSVFGKPKVDEDMINEYFARNQRKKQDEAWLKQYGRLIKEALSDTPKSVIGNYVVTVTVPDNSKFNEEKLMSYLTEKVLPVNGAAFKISTKLAIDEEGFTECVEKGLINMDEVKEFAWEEIKGSPRLTITERKASSDD